MDAPACFDVPSEARNIDLDLYSRQYYVYGGKAMSRLAEANVFLSGLSGVGIEIAKNIALAGVNSLTLHDPQPASYLDLSTQFFLSEADIGKSRADVVAAKIRELNAYVKIDVFSGDINTHPVEYFKQYKCVVLTEVPLETQVRINDYCHKEGIAFASAEVRGLFTWAFCDFGDKFEIHDKNGEEPVEVMIEGVTSENPGVVTTLDKAPHGLEDGTLLSFREVKGMTQLNESGRVFEVKVVNSSTFTIGDTSGFSPYQSGGIATEVKKTFHMNFLPLRDALEHGEFSIADWAKMDSSPNLHIGMQALHLFQKANNGQLPRPWNKDDADAFIKLCTEVNSKTKLKVDNLDESLLRKLAHTSRGSIVGLTAFMGGLVAQEAVKACTGKFSPLHQWLYFDAIEVLPRLEEGQEHDPENFQPAGNSRYDAQVICLGKKLVETIKGLKLFMVGSGAIGCEMLKNFAMLGVSAGSEGQIIVTDNDVIEKSNLNRQFLFRNHDIQKPKSTTAANAALAMNNELHIESHLKKVGTESEDIYTDHFFRSLDLVVNALDNINARLYVDQRCVTNQRALLESGTLGTKGHVQVIVPFLTESYGSRRDPPEKDVPFCTLKSFPNQIEHCIQWARDKFETNYNLQPTEHNKIVDDVKDFIQKLRETGGGDRLVRATKAVKYIENRPQNFDDCISWARITFEKNYPNKIKQLLHSFPLDQVTPEGGLFWSGAKRPPVVFEFDPTNSLHIDYVRYAAALRAKVWGITPEHVNPRKDEDNAYLVKICLGTTVPPFKPRDNKVIETDTNKKKEQVEAAKEEAIVEEFDEAKFTETLDKLASLVAASGGKLVTHPEEFEKDVDANFHIDFITATSNLRAASYAIAQADRLKTKRIAGRIMPAIATTTAAVSGLVSLELIKLADKRTIMADYKNAFLNLGLPVVNMAEPSAAEKTVITPSVSITLWDSWEIKLGDITLQQFVDHFHTKYNLSVTGVFLGVQMVYVTMMPGHSKRLPQKLRRVLTSLSPQDVKGQKYVDLIVTFEDEGGAEVNGPAVRFWLVGKRRKAATASSSAKTTTPSSSAGQ
eukprot:TRINITY_DN3622_c0_g1_i1.p1 TRINITY_DN3622_c0_g1~~TRINITY_DN3622_c0_g1_i1.p1  ORF type:complete len:1066 (-),score=192.27 TRINITY_DN3622_c0_g1_i1:111-3308(-)